MKILFMCETNATCSQLAEGLAGRILSDEIKVQSAGLQPSTIHPLTIQVLEEIGIKIRQDQGKLVTDLPETFLHDLDFVITFSQEEIQLPLLAQAKRLHWPMDDPAALPTAGGDQLQHFRSTLGHLRTQLEEFGREYDCLRRIA